MSDKNELAGYIVGKLAADIHPQLSSEDWRMVIVALRATATSAEPVGYDYGTEDSTATYGWHAAANGLFSTDPRVAKVWRQNMGLNVTPVYTHPAPDAAIVAALELAEDILARAPFSTSILPNGMHPQLAITQIRFALAKAKGGIGNE